MLILITKICNWRFQPSNQHRTMTEASSSNTPSITLTLMTQCWSVWRWCQLMGFVKHSTPVPIQTSSKPTLDLSLIMKVNHTSEPFCPTNSLVASTSSTSSLTDSFNHHINSVSTPLCLLAHLGGYLSNSMHIWCTSKMPTVHCFCQTNSLRQQP